MPRRNKLWRFAQLQRDPRYYELAGVGPEPGPLLRDHRDELLDMRGQWRSRHFDRQLPLTLELACGRGEYSIALAQAYPRQLFIGVDIKGARLFQGMRRVDELGLDNVAFLRARIENIDQFFQLAEVDEIWITFPDPFAKSVNRRLTSPRFWTSYARLLKPGGRIHLKTDDQGLYEYSQESGRDLEHFELLEDVSDIYALPSLPHPHLAYQTYYERMHLANGLSIKWLSWQRKETPAPEPFRWDVEDLSDAESGE